MPSCNWYYSHNFCCIFGQENVCVGLRFEEDCILVSGHSLEAAKNLIVLLNCGMDWIWVEFYIEYIYRVPRAQTVLWIHDYIFCGQSDQSTWSQETCQPPWAAYTRSSHNHTACMQISFRYREWQHHGHYLWGHSQQPFFWIFFCCQCVIYKVLELEGKSQLGKQFGYLFGCHFQVFKFGIAITQHLHWEDTG